MVRKIAIVLLPAAVTLAVLSFYNRSVVFSQSQSSPLAVDGVVSLRVRFGSEESKPTTWDGRVAVNGGELLGLRNWHPRPDDRVGKNDWSLKAEAGPLFNLRAWDELPVNPP